MTAPVTAAAATLFDTHCHLDDPKFTGEVAAVVERARAAGVAGMVTVGTSAASTRAAVEIAAAHPDSVWAAAGVHPHEADAVHTEEAFAAVASLASHPRVVAIGETGLDYYRRHADPANQKRLFSLHLALARETGKALIVHCRDAYDDLYAQLRAEMPAPIRGVMHCYSGPPEMARKFLDLGFCISIAGPVTFPNAAALRETARGVPLDRLVVETDAPYLAPQAFRGRRNEPAYATHAARQLATLQGVDFDRFCEAEGRTARALFGLSATRHPR
jgi:TatD DNase family protein